MSVYLIGLTTLIYMGTALSLFLEMRVALAVMYLSYAVANLSMIWVINASKPI